MNVLSKTGLAAGLFLAVFGMTNVAYGGFEKFFITGNPVTCEAVFDSLSVQHGISHGAVKTEVVFDPFVSGAGVVSFGPQTATITVTTTKSFDWAETTVPPEGFDVVSIKAGNGRTVYVYVPDEIGGLNLSDVNTTRKITEALICSDNQEEPQTNLDACALSPAQVGDVCAIIGFDQFFVHRAPGDVAGTSICACSGISSADCNTNTVCDPSVQTCTGDPVAGLCKPLAPDDPVTTTVVETQCCLQNPAGDELVLGSIPTGSSTVTLSGSICELQSQTIKIAGAFFSFTIQVCRDEQCQDGFDNDDDGLTDFPADPECTSSTDDSEAP